MIEIADRDGADADGRAECCDGGGDGSLLRAGGEPEGGVFDVAASDDLAGVEQDGGSHEEAAVRSIGAVRGGLGLYE